MAAILTLDDGRNLYGPTIGIGGMLSLIADSVSPEEAKLRFGFFLEALEYGTPPHGGIALGLDRICAILANESSIREVIAFPKTAAAMDVMTGAPSAVDAKQMRELHLQLRARPETTKSNA